MTDFLGLNRAVPNASLLNRDDPSILGFETPSWKHLARYVALTEGLPAEFDGGATGSGRALARVRSVVSDFGSPTRLRRLIEDRPDALSADRPPETLYASLAWMVAHLHRSASSVVTTLRDFPSLAQQAGDVKGALRRLGGDAENARKAIGPMVEALKRFKLEITDAHAALSAAYQADADELRRLQEESGAFDVKADFLRSKSAKLGLLGGGRKRELAGDLEALQRQQTASSSRSQPLRSALAAVEPIQDEGFWLQPGVDDMVGFLDRLRHVLTAFGSGMTQIAADGSDNQLQDPAGIGKVLGREEAIARWSAIDRAAAKFLAQATAAAATINEAAGAPP